MTEQIGVGKIVIDKKGRRSYRGTNPYQMGDEVYLVRKEDLDSIIIGDTNALLLTREDMPRELYDVNTGHFPDEIVFMQRDGRENKMFLDRKLYTTNAKDMIFLRYETIDAALWEEDLK